MITAYTFRTENKTRIIKMTSFEGEFILLGRLTEDVANIFVQYGQGATRTVNITGGPGLQEAEFIDGLKVSIRANGSMAMNVEIQSDTAVSGTLPHGFTAVSTLSLPIFRPFHIIAILFEPQANPKSADSYLWVVNTSAAGNLRDASLLVPCKYYR